jgi:hypothetical protein
MEEHMKVTSKPTRLVERNLELATKAWGNLSETTSETLTSLTKRYALVVSAGDLILLNGKWYVTHSVGLARRKRCAGIHFRPAGPFCDLSARRWAFKATVFKSPKCRGFVGYGDADPSNVSSLVHGAEMRVAETRAVNRALRKAYGIGVCSVEEIGSRRTRLELDRLSFAPSRTDARNPRADWRDGLTTPRPENYTQEST